ncbi:MAG: type II and III secretion system protein family protein, partial [Burkholderiales bacterium]
PALSQAAPAAPLQRAPTRAPERTGPVEMGPAMTLTVGKSTLLRLPAAIDRISVGNPAVADVTLISARELYLLGKTFGSTNVILWESSGQTTVFDVTVEIDTAGLRSQLLKILPDESGIEVRSAADSVVLSGVVSNAVRAHEAVEISEGFMRAYARGISLPITTGANPAGAPGAGGALGNTLTIGDAAPPQSLGTFRPRVINLLRVAQPGQVMLEVKVAEISKTLLDRLGTEFGFSRSSGSWSYGILNSLLSNSGGALFGRNSANTRSFTIDGERRDALVKVLAEPNLVAMSGQEASFLAGGKIFIPVARNTNNGVTTISLEEKEFGVGVKFTPTVLDRGRINLKVAPEVSELNQNGNPFATVGGVTSVLPSFTTRRAQTTVQLMDGQSLAIGGLIKNNVTESMRKLPFLGELPILGALFRSAEFQADRSELLFIITPRLVKPVDGDSLLAPTDTFTPPTRGEWLGGGQFEGSGHPDVPPDRAPARAPAPSGNRMELR